MTHPQQGGGYGQPQQGGYGPLPGYPQPGGYGPHPPKKPNTGLIVGIISTVVVAALGLVLVLVLTGDDDDKSPGSAGGGGPGGPGIADPTLDYTATDDAPAGGANGPGSDSGPDSGPGGGPDSGPDSGPGSGSDTGGSGGPAGSTDPRELVQEIARIFETHDVDALQYYACDSRSLRFFERDLEQLEGATIKVEKQNGVWCAHHKWAAEN